MFERARQRAHNFITNVQQQHTARLGAYRADMREFYEQQADKTAAGVREAGATENPAKRTWKEFLARRNQRLAIKKKERLNPEPNIVTTALGGGRRTDRVITQAIPAVTGYVISMVILNQMERRHVWPFNR